MNYESRIKNKFSISNGFTLVELLIIIGIMGILSSFAVINLIRPQTKASLDSTVNVLISDIKGQQLKAMIGDGEGGSAAPCGIYFETNKYTLFKGSSYSPSDVNNFVVNIDGGTTITNAFVGNQVSFQQRNGEVIDFTALNNTITLTSGGDSKTVTINVLGNLNIN